MIRRSSGVRSVMTTIMAIGRDPTSIRWWGVDLTVAAIIICFAVSAVALELARRGYKHGPNTAIAGG